MPRNNSQQGFVPIVPLVVLSIGVLAIIAVIAFSIKSYLPSNSQTMSPLASSTPEPTPLGTKTSDFSKIELYVDLTKTRTVYCINQQADLINSENEQYKKELQTAQSCRSNFEVYAAEQTELLTSCTNDCESSQSARIKNCETTLQTTDPSDYYFLDCKRSSDELYNACSTTCKGYATKSQVEYNRDCQKPVVDQAFRIDDLVKKYCQNTPN